MKPRYGIRNLMAALLCLYAGMATAQFGGRWGVRGDVELMARYDTDKNGYLDKKERLAAYRDLTGDARFSRADDAVNDKVTAVNPSLKPAQVKNYPGKSLYDVGVLRTVFLNFDDTNWEAEMAAFKGTDIDVPATATVDGNVYKNVGVHFRGSTSFRDVPDGYKRSMKVSFDFIDKKQTIMGQKALELMNAAADATYVRAVLYLQIARDYLPAPKANFIRVVINGENWGIYVNSQPFNGDFVKEVTGANGARWKVPGSPNARGGLEYFGDDANYYRSVFEITSKDTADSWADLIKLTKILNDTPPNKLETALKSLLDVDGVLRFLAVDNALINNDGYWVRASDYSIYRDGNGVFHVTPHDVNEAMRNIERMGRWRNGGSSGSTGSGVALDPLISINDPTKPLLSKLLAVPAFKQRYLNYVRDIATKWLDWSRLGPLATQYQALIATDVKLDQRKLYSNEAFATGLTQDGMGEDLGVNSTPDISLKSFVQERRRYLLDYLSKANSTSTAAKHIN